MKRILCYGDSNTWGFIPGSTRKRFDENTRWTRLLQNLLNGDFEIIEEGLCGRTLCTVDKRLEKVGKNGFSYFVPCVNSHDKFDILILMLGTNELKKVNNASAQDVLIMLSKYVEFIENYRSEQDGGKILPIICGIPNLYEEQCNQIRKNDKFDGAEKKCKEVNILYKNYCEENGIIFVDNSDLEVGIDGLHLNQIGHKQLAEKLEKIVKEINFDK